MDKIIVKGARENNLKNIDIEIPKNSLVVMTGLSGSGKSSLAFDTIYAEGQRRYVESLSAYARQFLGNSEKPDVDSIEGLSPAISIDQKTTNRNPRSTVGTVTEIYDYMRLLFARIGTPYCPTHKEPITSQSIDEIVNKVLELEIGSKLQIISPIVNLEKGTHAKTLEHIKKEGFVRLRVNGEVVNIDELEPLEKNKKHKIDVVVDRIKLKEDIRQRLSDSIETALKLSKGKVIIDEMEVKEHLFSENYACKYCDFSISELEPRLFSFNSPVGACETCNGLGTMLEVDEDLVVPNKELSLIDGAIAPFKNSDVDSIMMTRILQVAEHYNIDINIPVKDIDRDKFEKILFGTDEEIKFSFKSKSKSETYYNPIETFEGIIPHLQRRYLSTTSDWSRKWIEGFMTEHVCNTCKGARLKKANLHVLINGKNINDFTNMSIVNLLEHVSNLDLDVEKQKISELLIKEIKERLSFLINVGLDYLTLSRSAGTLSGGESQRIRLATQIGSRLTGVLYVLDEPSIGLHQRDNERLINTLLGMRDLGNTLIVVEHDEDTMRASDFLVDIGPMAGIHGGEVVAAGTPDEVMNNDASLTGKYLSGKEKIEVPTSRRPGNGSFITIKGAKENNLKNINTKIPMGLLCSVTGVSGSGKSTLINEILYKSIHSKLYKTKDKPGKHKEVISDIKIEKIIDISQSPIGRTPRSNPATYTGVFDHIRDLFAATNEAKSRGYSKGRFSFNVKGGRCETCKGDGVKKISMHFLPDVYVPCEVCGGTKYNNETLQVKFKGKSIHDVLDMTIEDANVFFENHPKIKDKLQTLLDVGLGYIKLGQSSTTLSGGEAQRVKLASELYKRITDKTLYILDEPTTGLHSDDVKRLIAVLNRIVNEGASVVVIEHNLDVIKVSDYIIDLGPEGGDKGGGIVATGTPEEVVKVEGSHTARFLKEVI